GVLSVELVPQSSELGISPVWAGLIGASSLIGIFFGAPIGGFLTDRFGRKQLFLIDICLFVVLGVLQAFVTEAWQLFVVRLLLGIAIGAEYSIGSSMLSEFVPAHRRGRRVSYMLVFWYSGYLVSVVAGYGLLEGLGWSWRWTLATSAIPALIVLGLRIGLPESPRWLMLHGRTDDARAIIDRYLGGEEHMAEADYGSDTKNEAGWRQLFAPGMRSRTFFVCTFYICVVTPYFAIFTFAPKVFESLKLNEMAGTIFANSIAFIGAIAGMLTIELIGRRKQTDRPVLDHGGGIAGTRAVDRCAADGAGRRLRGLRVLQRPDRQPHRRVPDRVVPDRRAGHRGRHRQRVQPDRGCGGHVPAPSRDRDHRPAVVHGDRGGDVRDRRRGVPAARPRDHRQVAEPHWHGRPALAGDCPGLRLRLAGRSR
ncbi:MAG: MFS transporter, partial [Pseudonocardiaceae bacterium]